MCVSLQKKVISAGQLTKEPEVEDTTPSIDNAPDIRDIDVAEITRDGERKKRDLFNTIVEKLEGRQGCHLT